MRGGALLAGLAATAIASGGCAERTPVEPPPDATSVVRSDGPADVHAWLRGLVGGPSGPGADAPALLAGAGDIARCYPGANATAYSPPGPMHPAARTARLLDALPGATVMTVGDNAYEFGSPFDYLGCYHPTWGRHRSRTMPAAGNHEYLTPGAAGYFAYFAERSAPPLGYYSYDLGSWHVVVLNSTPQVYACWPPEADEVLADFPSPPPVPDEVGVVAGRACAGDVAQQRWLAADLAANPRVCTAVYFHHPRFSSGRHGSHFQMTPVWDTLYRYGVDVVVSAHDHLYERFAPQTPDGALDTQWGIRQLTVGTGGAELYGDVHAREDNSEVLIDTAHGIAVLALEEGRYRWAFVDVDRSVLDSGSEFCHGPPPAAPGAPPEG